MSMVFDACQAIPAHEVAQRAGLTLQQRGAHLWTRCPLHTEKTASMCFFPNGRWKCFGCHEGGDSVAFLSALRDITPLEAAKQIDAMYSLHLFDKEGVLKKESI